MPEHRGTTIGQDEEREWLQRLVERSPDGGFARAADRMGFEAVLEASVIAEASGVLHRVDLRTTPWAGRPLLKRRLEEARRAMAALRADLEAEVYGR